MGEEYTFSLIRPHALVRAKDIRRRIKISGLKIFRFKKIRPSAKDLNDLYRDHIGKEWFSSLFKTMCDKWCVVMVIKGNDAVKKLRDIIGKDPDPKKNDPGSCRFDFGDTISPNRQTRCEHNVIHGSDGRTSAAREIKIFFPEMIIEQDDFIHYVCLECRKDVLVKGFTPICQKCGKEMQELYTAVA